MNAHYDLYGKPLDLMEWATKLESDDRRIAESTIWFGLVWVSTVWLGLDHDFEWMRKHEPGAVNPRPLQFETMAFVRGHGGYMRRWRSKGEAELGHKQVVRELMNPITMLRRWWQWR